MIPLLGDDLADRFFLSHSYIPEWIGQSPIFPTFSPPHNAICFCPQPPGQTAAADETVTRHGTLSGLLGGLVTVQNAGVVVMYVVVVKVKEVEKGPDNGYIVVSSSSSLVVIKLNGTRFVGTPKSTATRW